MADPTEAERAILTCAKYRCGRRAITVELEQGPGAERFPSALCKEHARNPGRIGTLAQPTLVRR